MSPDFALVPVFILLWYLSPQQLPLALFARMSTERLQFGDGVKGSQGNGASG